MEQYLYDIFQTSGKNGCADLTIALAMFLSNAREGRQQYGPDGLDYEALHRDYPALEQGQEQLRLFLGRHYTDLTQAYRAGDREVFNQAVAQCQEKDAARAEEAEAQE